MNSSGSGQDWWFNPPLSSHHFVCSRSETVYLAAGTYAIDVGAAARVFKALDLWNGHLTVKMTQFAANQKMIGNVPMLQVPN